MVDEKGGGRPRGMEGGEEMEERRARPALLVGVVFCLVMSSTSPGAVVYTRLMDLGFLFNTWYDYTGGSPAGNINFNKTSINLTSTLYTEGDVYTLGITGTLTFTSDLYSDYSSGGLAKGLFEGGSTVKIVGGLKQGGSYVYGGTGGNAKQIFEATLRPVHDDGGNPTADRWSLEEDVYTQGNFNRTLRLELVAGSEGLVSGITIGTDTLTIVGTSEYPNMKLELKTTTTVNDFAYDINSGYLASHVKINSIPEPATFILVGLGTLLLRTRIKKK